MINKYFKSLLISSFLFFLSLFCTQEVEAFSTTQSVEYSDGIVSVEVKNISGTPYYELSYKVYVQGVETDQPIESEIINQVEGGSSDIQNFDISNLIDESGRYLVYVKGYYFDSNDPYVNRFPAHFLAYTVVDVDLSTVPTFALKSADLELDRDEGILSFDLENKSDDNLNLSYDLILPEGLILEDESEDFSLDSNTLSSKDVELKNSWLWNGYSSNLLLEVKDLDSDYLEYVKVPFTVTDESNPYIFSTWYLITSGILIAIFAVFKILKFNKWWSWLPLLAIVFLFAFEIIPLSYIFSDTTTTGGDTFYHYISARVLRYDFLPKFRVSGWFPGSYGGFPLFVFYMPIPYLLMSLFSLILPFNIAFKLISISGAVLMPIAAYFCAKFMKFSKYSQILAAAFSVVMVFNEAYTIYGGNMLSSLAGEFSQQIGIMFLLFYTGFLYRGVEDKKYWKINSILLALIGLTHPYPFILAVIMQLFFVLPKFNDRKDLKENFLYLLKVDFLGFLLVAFWALTMVFNIGWTTASQTEFWELIFDSIIPEHLYPFFIIALLTTIYAFFKKDKKANYLLITVFFSVVLLFFSNNLKLVNIRFVPSIVLYSMLIAAYGLGLLLEKVKIKIKVKVNIIEIIKHIVVISLIAFSLFTAISNQTSANSWSKWNYSGIENKPFSTLFEDMVEYIRELPGNERIFYEHSTMQEGFGTNRTFEALYEFTGKPTHEGTFIQASESSPFVYYIQSEISQISTNVLHYRDYTTTNLTQAKDHFELFNARYMIASSNVVKDQLDADPDFIKLKDFNPYSIYELKTNSNSYVEVLQDSPIFTQQEDWTDATYNWFINHDPNIYINSADSLVSSDSCDFPITMQDVDGGNISFTTKNIGCPHYIKVSYFPNWKVKGADKIYQASPNFMVVYPTEENVELTYVRGAWEWVGIVLTGIGIAVIAFSKKIEGYILVLQKYFNKVNIFKRSK